MADRDSHEPPNIYPNLSALLSKEQQFRLNKINEIKDYFVAEIKERELMSSCSISIGSFATFTGAPTGMTSASFSLAFSISVGIVKHLLKATRNKKEKHNKIVMLAWSKLNSRKSKISEAAIKNKTSHEDFMTIINEEKKYRELKESIRMMNSQVM